MNSEIIMMINNIKNDVMDQIDHETNYHNM
jgi:hypothetical protein